MTNFVAFARERKLLALFWTSGLKHIFHWYAHFDIFKQIII